jgi:hypothetical protein
MHWHEDAHIFSSLLIRGHMYKPHDIHLYEKSEREGELICKSYQKENERYK